MNLSKLINLHSPWNRRKTRTNRIQLIRSNSLNKQRKRNLATILYGVLYRAWKRWTMGSHTKIRLETWAILWTCWNIMQDGRINTVARQYLLVSKSVPITGKTTYRWVFLQSKLWALLATLQETDTTMINCASLEKFEGCWCTTYLTIPVGKNNLCNRSAALFLI